MTNWAAVPKASAKYAGSLPEETRAELLPILTREMPDSEYCAFLREARRGGRVFGIQPYMATLGYRKERLTDSLRETIAHMEKDSNIRIPASALLVLKRSLARRVAEQKKPSEPRAIDLGRTQEQSS